MFQIVYLPPWNQGKLEKRYFKTLEEAKKVASIVFDVTGVVVGIAETPNYEEIIASIHNNWINGNMTAVSCAFTTLTPEEAAYVATQVQGNIWRDDDHGVAKTAFAEFLRKGILTSRKKIP